MGSSMEEKESGKASQLAMELPECPVCLQVYDEEETIPRVLSCGHSTCSPCIAQLCSSSSFRDTIRCPACNQVVPCPRGAGPAALPKNIDLLRLCSDPSSRPSPPRPPRKPPADFLPLPWDERLFSAWKDRILPSDAVNVSVAADEMTESAAATVTGMPSYGPDRCFGEKQHVRLLAVGDSSSFSSSSLISNTNGCEKLELSYTARVMEALCKLTEKERAELEFVMVASSRQRRGLCRVFGLWMSSMENSPLFLVCERFQFDLSRMLGGLEEHKMGPANADEVFTFAKVGLELCELIMGLHSEGVVCGCLTPSCLCFDGYGHCLLDLSAVLLVGRSVRKEMAEARRRNGHCTVGELQKFLSPELFASVHSDHTFSDFRSEVVYESDVWSVALILVVLLLGDRQLGTWLSEVSTGHDCVELSLDTYDVWMKKLVVALKAPLLGTKLESLLPILESCLNYDPVKRPSVNDIWTCIMSLFIKPHCTAPAGSDVSVAKRDIVCCLVLGSLCCLPKDEDHLLMQERNILEETEKISDNLKSLALTGNGGRNVEQENADWNLAKGFHGNGLKCISLQGHQDCITGLAIGGGFLFSSSLDKTVRVWSLEDFSLVQTLRAHEHRIMALVVVNAIKQLCITGDSGGCLYAWNIGSCIDEVPLKKWYDHTDWRYSGVHSLAVSGSQCLYSGSGDKLIKAWSLQDYSLTCTMTGHKSVVSSLVASDGILYSGSWDGTIRLWWLHDHSPLAVLEDDRLLTGTSVLSLSLHNNLLFASCDNGFLKIWRNDVLLKSIQIQNSALFAVELDRKWLFTGGWDKIILVQELSENDSQVELRPVGSISCDSVVTSLLHWEGKLFAGSNKNIKVYSSKGMGDRSMALSTA